MKPPCFGLLAELATADALLDAVRRIREQGYRQIEAYTPFSVDGLADALELPKNRVPLISLLGGVIGGAGAFFMQWYSAVVAYPLTTLTPFSSLPQPQPQNGRSAASSSSSPGRS